VVKLNTKDQLNSFRHKTATFQKHTSSGPSGGVAA